MSPRCPGQDMRYWKPDDIFEIQCPHCEEKLEFFKDEPFLICRKCQTEVRNPRIDLGCAKWCKFAAECLGEMPNQDDEVGSLCDRLQNEMKAVFGDDQRRIDHALQVLTYATDILASESDADPLTVKAAAILHDIGIPTAEKMHNSAAGKWQEIEGPPIAREVLTRLGIDEEIIDHVCRIIGSHHSAKDIDTPEFWILWDADWLVNFQDAFPDIDKKEKRERIQKLFHTRKGRILAESLFL